MDKCFGGVYMKKEIIRVITCSILAVAILTGCAGKKVEGKAENKVEDKVESKVIYTEGDIYINSFNCGYISQKEKPGPQVYIIENEEQLAYAKERYGLGIPTNYSYDQLEYFRTDIIDVFEEMEEDYPIEQYSYVFSYEEVNSTGYYLHADRLILEDDTIYFGMDNESHVNQDEVAGDMMDGFFHMAAIPKEYLEGYEFLEAVYPDADDFQQDINFRISVGYDLADKRLYDRTGKDVYLFQTRDEFDAFLSEVSDIPLYERRTLDGDYNFNEIAVAYIFFTREEPYTFVKFNDISIQDGKVFIDYELQKENPGEKTDSQTGMIIMTFSKKFLM